MTNKPQSPTPPARGGNKENQMRNIIHTEDFTTAKGTHYRVEIMPDGTNLTPWVLLDSYGPVSEWTRRDKRAGELILATDGRSKRLYNFQEAIKKAKAEGWGCDGLTGNETPGEKAVKAVMADFKYFKAWCNNEWHYAVLHVVLLDSEGEEIAEYDDYLGGVEYGLSDYWEKEAANMAEGLERTLKTATDKQLAWLRSTCAPCKVERVGI